jgi:phosphoserine phosphatase
MNLALFDFDGTITSSDTWTPFMRFACRYALVYAYGDSGEDREMIELAHKKYYRWTEIVSWNDVASYGHPSVAGQARGTEHDWANRG